MKDFLNNHFFIFLLGFLIALVLFSVLTLFVASKRKKGKYKKKLEELEKEKNLIVSAPILSEIAKIEEFVKNEKLENRIKTWQSEFEYIQTNEINRINDLIFQLDMSVDTKSAKETLIKIARIELEIFKVRSRTNMLLKRVQEITLSEEKNRGVLTRHKSSYRELLATFNKHKKEYGEFKNIIKLQFENIEKRFNDFEEQMEQNNYDDIIHIINALDKTLKHMVVVLEEVPSITLLANIIIPKKISTLKNVTKEMEDEGFVLDYLNIDYNIEESAKKISTILEKAKILNLEDAVFELKTISNYFDNLFRDLDNERKDKLNFDTGKNKLRLKIEKLSNLIEEIFNEVEKAKKIYDLSELEISELDKLRDNVNNLYKDTTLLFDSNNSKSFAYSILLKELNVLDSKYNKLDEKLSLLLNSISVMKEDEKRAKEQLDEIQLILAQAKNIITSVKIPHLNKSYYVELKEAEEAIHEINVELSKEHINIETLNTRVDTARDLAFKFYNTSVKTIKDAKLLETIIVYANRYRPINKHVKDALKSAEISFFDGQYDIGINRVLKVLQVFDPIAYDSISKVI